jgi:hypothetical protein
MTVKKAIQIIDWWIGHKQKVMEELRRKWDYNTFEEATGIEKLIFNADKIAIANLQAIREQLVPNCKHPLKMRDVCKGQKYCMNCNMDL